MDEQTDTAQQQRRAMQSVARLKTINLLTSEINAKSFITEITIKQKSLRNNNTI